MRGVFCQKNPSQIEWIHHISGANESAAEPADCRATYDGMIRKPAGHDVSLPDDHFTFHVWVECASVVVRAFFLCDVAPRCSRPDSTGIKTRLLAYPSAVAV